MHPSRSFLSAILALIVPSSLAAPQYPPLCDTLPASTSYSITSQQTNVPGPAVIGDYSTGGGGSLSDSSTYSTGITVTVGVQLTLDPDDIAGNAGISASVATTTTKGTTQGISDMCPAGAWTCGLSIEPQMISVSGVQTITLYEGLCPDSPSSSAPFTMLLPTKNSDGLSSGNANICTCENFADWADPGHPGLICPQDCPE